MQHDGHHFRIHLRSDMSKNEDRITVIADDRERKSEVIQFLSEMKNVSVAIKRLSLGDYLVVSLITI
jgi:ERCC4-type nuclease